ncbi:hypothetical protein Zmor_024021 [Zophobas morio]|uniref:Uncharacterized protein n=1 Tax=Zophobas morio TaxID=2755281 RepID=A0AA38M7U1_9CUCU|nr:hypothetical protein Zmor_024021 [Zophobas morio]
MLPLENVNKIRFDNTRCQLYYLLRLAMGKNRVRYSLAYCYLFKAVFEFLYIVPTLQSTVQHHEQANTPHSTLRPKDIPVSAHAGLSHWDPLRTSLGIPVRSQRHYPKEVAI